ncbi:MAG: fructose-bisphosphatase class I [Candidatus Magasanikbacteria bacterium CG11_big_fil_rev_8_21_14_0_20_39_34]|uniref:Fructose-1,6-bisphosphatase class 1 n=1 Tax=Candidatus Magasanikbacteria bacterium CG11_big_fil_rev_8_21_14_0_20_39_34 TaxID=1974653 RepID=A0A2H0N5Z6_9BACT|nr:MAG: fructose-bisphosphatase class I [Candidatus Magasanikbacteria bacterium CG11_big_fil_rev_8_21_14_0_20_39_34]
MPQTLTQFLLQHLADHTDQKDLTLIVNDLGVIGKILSHEINRAGLSGILGVHGSTNIQGEVVQKLDSFANELCKDYLRQTGHFAALASEEEDSVVDMEAFGKDAKYIIAFDPLDGSSNIDVNGSIGTLFSVHSRIHDLDRLDEKQFLQRGRDQVLAGYILYGSSTVFVFSLGNGVFEFTLNQGMGEFILSRENIKIPKKLTYYSVNESNTKYFEEKYRLLIEGYKQNPDISARYVGALVADFHRNLIKGGVFLYPGVDREGNGVYKGKLRLNYELKPLAFLLEQAGGVALCEQVNILEITPNHLHERAAVILTPEETFLQL